MNTNFNYMPSQLPRPLGNNMTVAHFQEFSYFSSWAVSCSAWSRLHWQNPYSQHYFQSYICTSLSVPGIL